MADLRRFWRRDPEPPGYVDEDDLRAQERARRAGALFVVLSVVAVFVGYAAGSFAGLVVVFSGIAVLGLLILAVGVPAAPAGARRRRRRSTPGFSDAPYPTFQQVGEQLSWAQVSPRHYDMVTRPLLARLLAARLLDRHGVDLHREPERARAVVGEDLWWWFDPDRAPESSSQPPGVDDRTLTRLVDRLEKL